jgi:hypothetical protein
LLDNAFKFSNKFSLGVSAAFRFVRFDRTQTLQFSSYSSYRNAQFIQTAQYKGFWFAAGFRWEPTPRFAVGGYVRPEGTGNWNLTRRNNDHLHETEREDDGTSPMQIGGGILLRTGGGLMLTADAQMQSMTREHLGIFYDSVTVNVSDPLFVSLGVEKPVVLETARNNILDWAWRGGLFYRSHSWTTADGDPVTDTGVSLGSSIPLAGFQGQLHWALEFGMRGDDEENFGATENFWRLAVQVEMSEKWFVRPKRKYGK